MNNATDCQPAMSLAEPQPTTATGNLDQWVRTISGHWPEYVMEASLLGLFMVSACLFSIALFYVQSPIVGLIPSDNVRLALMGIAMGVTAVALIYSPWGKQSGAHFNPAVTLTFWRLGRIPMVDAVFYCVAECLGGVAGVLVVAVWLKPYLTASTINYSVTVPGQMGPAIAWITEFFISLMLMTTVLVISNERSIARYTGMVVGVLVAIYIFFAAPISGMSMNPARTLGSALPSGIWTAIWIYFTAPPLGMLASAQVYLIAKGRRALFCAKLHHQNHRRCIFCQSRMSQK